MQENPEIQEKKEPKESDFKAPEEIETGYTEKSWEKPERTMETGEAGELTYEERKRPFESEFKAPGELEAGYTEKSWEKPERTIETEEKPRIGTGEGTREGESAGYTKEKRLTRSKSDRMIFGVCGGLGKYFGIDPTLIRLGFALLALMNGIGILIYIILAIIMPQEDSVR